MLKQNKFKVILSSVVILLPVLFGVIMWDLLPDTMVTHWDVSGSGDGFNGKVFTVFILPFVLLIGHLLCLFFTSLDKRQKDQNKKALGMVFWIIPVTSLFTNGFVYAIALGKDISVNLFVPVLLGLIFILIGNYLPKTKQNSTLGVKISWTLNNEENWNKTHRLCGKVWVIGGITMIFSVFLPLSVSWIFIICLIIIMTVIPIVYSYSIYKRHKKEGVEYVAPTKSKAEKIAYKISLVVVTIIIAAVVVVMFTGNINVNFDETKFNVNTDFWDDIQVPYEDIDTITYSKDFDKGMRTYGFGSAKLSLGNFKNEDLGSYTLYAYNGAKEFIIIRSDDETLVIGMKDSDQTQEIYNYILEKTNQD